MHSITLHLGIKAPGIRPRHNEARHAAFWREKERSERGKAMSIDDYILGNDALHDRFRVTTQIVGKALSNAPNPVTIPQLKNLTGRSTKELARLCNRLSQAGLLESVTQKQDEWRLACDPGETTLEDVFRCILTEQFDSSKQMNTKRNHIHRSYRDVDLLIMQVSIAINQSVFKHLRQFTLERLKLSVSGVFPFTQQPVPNRQCDKAREVLSANNL
jgi:DNA-binding IscR family transcriptional regulator